MAERSRSAPTRMDRRKARTRGALIRAAQSFLAQGTSNVPILEITQAADVGLGSFYNHFESREQLFAAAVEDVLDRLGAVLDELTASPDDPAEVFAQAFRLTGRMHRLDPELSKVLLNSGFALVSSPRGLAPRARRDIAAAVRAGRFPAVHDLDLAIAVVGGAALSLGHYLHAHPDRDDAEAVDQVTEGLLRMFGVPPAEAADICRRPLPELTRLPD
ncbi:TetR/AcrR family transcriptional regulator [Thermomonospora curvata]|uniref:Transcriptional regulator, TetR family n=1 Tax=Thermomonospora curvata (strain ATCC 19995 / DSM 43183 / JCM 3096 / KCTC 9072 / NBRC 15933 / NCIMB 10081 / Henssen B9) TaxID=471852 RepID=D1A5G0_THECD|nr:TetR/AcrR family transcriptional regulator [Thermomonospora curvata]ACY96320.1 transcriptional regulator, TetR family [Thermomonospora curvata DSM 43183]